MKPGYAFLLILLTFQALQSQGAYFQQEVNYKIDVSLNTAKHELAGHISILYKNNSPDVLDKIYMHLWPNAYSGKNTAFAKQQLEIGMTDFHFAKDSELGYIDSLAFEVDDQEVTWKLEGKDPDIALLLLNEALAPGESIVISTPFKVRIPKSFSRMGRHGNSYQLTQWYPKPAVYDKQGWHPIPYLALGEFYSEYGSFEVNITVPDNQIVAATGNLQNQEEIEWLNALSSGADNNRDASKTKTLSYTESNIHDFAWFTNPDFHVDKAEVNLADRNVDLWTFYTDVQKDWWDKATAYTAASIEYMSKTIGSYPYKQFSVVQAPMQAGGGMEYPTITVIDQVTNAEELNHVIAHEVGHNWFYGVLGFNERTSPWLDEGLTTYYDHRYINQALDTEDRFKNYLPSFIQSNVDYPLINYGVLTQSARHLDQPVNTTSENLSLANYVISAYMKPTLLFQYLEDYLGTKKIDELISSFYEQWKFKHPTSEDLEAHFGANVNQNLDWFFDGFVKSNDKMNYGIISKKTVGPNYEITVLNKGEVNAPYNISAIKDNKKVISIWQEGHEAVKVVEIPKDDYDKIYLDAEARSLDIDRYDNSDALGFFKGWKTMEYKFGAGLDDDIKHRRFFYPSLAFNAYDGLMLGIGDYSALAPQQKFQDHVNINYGFGSKSWSGIYNLRFNKFSDNTKPKQLSFGVNSKKFSYNDNERFGYDLGYWKVSPYVSFRFKPDFKHPTTHHFEYYFHLYQTESPEFINAEYIGKNWDDVSINHQFWYTMDKQTTLFPHSVQLLLEYESYTNVAEEPSSYLNMSIEWDSKFMFAKDKYIGLRLFYSKFLSNTQRDIGSVNNAFVRGTRSLSYQGFTDNYEELFIGRTDQSGIWSQQVLMREGGFKYNTGSSFANLGQSNDYIASVNLTLDPPLKLPSFLPLQFYFDAGVYNAKSTTMNAFESKLLYSGGIQLNLMDDAIVFYIPVINSSSISDAYSTLDASFFRKIAFNINLRKLNPWKIIDRVGW